MERCAPAVAALSDYFRALIGARRRQPRNDLISALIAQTEGGALSDDELLSTSIFLLWAGHETTKNLIGNGLLALLQHPDQLAMLRQNPGLIDSAVEELLRYESPVQKIGRWTTEDITIGASTVPAGRYLISLLGAANRDPQQYADPDRLDISRGGGRHLAFGHGIHLCLGASLARIEAQIAINTALRRFPKLALATDRVEWRRYTAFRSLEALPVVF
jgi:cytochrome P450